MSNTACIITIDAEGDDLWGRPREITTLNAGYLPRFQALCERFRFKPVYLTNHEMAASPAFVEFGRDVIARGAGEIGMHLHAWNSPPLYSLTNDDFRYQPYLIEYPDRVMKEKIKTHTGFLEDQFDQKMFSHRAGRWAFDGRYAAMLIEEGYRVDCSVTPGVDWRRSRGAPHGNGGSNYRNFPSRPYFFNPSDISSPASGGLLEVPVTICPSTFYRRVPLAYRIRLVRRFANKASPGLRWLCPGQSDLESMLRAAAEARAQGADHVEFMLHSSELMPGGSQNFRDAAAIERLYEDLEILFEDLSAWSTGMTLKEFHTCFEKAPDRPAQTSQDAGHPGHVVNIEMART